MAEMRIAVVTLFPEMFRALTQYGVCGRGFQQGILDLELINPRQFTRDRHHTVDDRPYGGGPGMVMLAQPLVEALRYAKKLTSEKTRVIYPSPQGQPLNQAKVVELASLDSLIFLAGRYEGVDERLLETAVDEEISLGDFVVSGGELPIMAMVDAVARFMPGVLGNEQSTAMESHGDGLLDCPHYTRPEQVLGQTVPKVLLSGDHAAIRRWRLQMSLARTWQRRPDLLARRTQTAEEESLLSQYLNNKGTDADAC